MPDKHKLAGKDNGPMDFTLLIDRPSSTLQEAKTAEEAEWRAVLEDS